MRFILLCLASLVIVPSFAARMMTIGEYSEEISEKVTKKITETLSEGGGEARMAGTVTCVADGQFFIQKGNDGMKVVTSGRRSLPRPGDEVAIVGSPIIDGGRIAFAATSWEKTGAVELPEPIKVTPDALMKGEIDATMNWRLVEVRGRALDVTENGFALTVDSAPLNVMMAPLPEFLLDCGRTHPKVKVVGVADLILDHSALVGGNQSIIGVRLKVSSPENVTLEPDAAYLLARRGVSLMKLSLAVAAVLAVGLVVFAVVIFRQRRRIFRSRTVAAERKRMADDLHDTIEQYLVGAGMLLKLNRLKEAQGVLVRAKREIRDIVWGLKNDDMMRLSPTGMLRRLAHEENTKGLYRVDTRLEGLPEALNVAAMRDLCLIVREAIGNAVKHGGAKHIAISSDCVDGRWRLRIANDGTPFDPASAPGEKEGHFGLEGMRQRAHRLRANLSISRRKGGMVITVEENA